MSRKLADLMNDIKCTCSILLYIFIVDITINRTLMIAWDLCLYDLR